MYIDVGMFDKLWLWFERFYFEVNMGLECYFVNIDVYGERGYVDEVEKVFFCC